MQSVSKTKEEKGGIKFIRIMNNTGTKRVCAQSEKRVARVDRFGTAFPLDRNAESFEAVLHCQRWNTEFLSTRDSIGASSSDTTISYAQLSDHCDTSTSRLFEFRAREKG